MQKLLFNEKYLGGVCACPVRAVAERPVRKPTAVKNSCSAQMPGRTL